MDQDTHFTTLPRLVGYPPMPFIFTMPSERLLDAPLEVLTFSLPHELSPLSSIFGVKVLPQFLINNRTSFKFSEILFMYNPAGQNLPFE